MFTFLLVWSLNKVNLTTQSILQKDKIKKLFFDKLKKQNDDIFFYY